jgi:hypothetical protein
VPPVPPVPSPQSFTIQIAISPKKIIKRFKQFIFDKLLSEFRFCDEYGVEYIVQCISGRENVSPFLYKWTTVITVIDSFNPVEDINKFVYWLSDNFKDNDSIKV